MTAVTAVSVVIPTHNRASYLPAALDSVFAQSVSNLEVIVVDDASTDGTAQVLARYAGRIRVITRAASGGNAAHARNDGLRAARGAYVAFLDSDDIWMADKLARQLEVLENDAGVGFGFGNVVFVEHGIQSPPAVKGALPSGWILSALADDMFVHPSTLIVRRTLIERVGPFSESIGTAEAYDFLLRLARMARAAAVDEPVAIVSRHDRQCSRADLATNYDSAIVALEELAADDTISPSVRRTARRTIARHHTTVARMLCKDGQPAAARQRIRAAIRRRPLFGAAWATALRSLRARAREHA